VSYDFEVPAAAPVDARALREAISLPELRGFPQDDRTPDGVFHLYREGTSTRTTDVSWHDEAAKGSLRVVVRALASREDCDLALRVVEAAAALAGAREVHADYFGTIPVTDVRRLHTVDWMNEQAASATGALAALIRDGKGPISMPGPRRACWIGARLLADLEGAGLPEALPARVLTTLRRVQWDVPPGFRDAGVFVSGPKEHEARFAVWLPDEDLILPRVDYVALRARTGEVVMVPFTEAATLAGSRAARLDECQLLVPASTPEEWAATVARARTLAATPRRN
jgi:hypothetical protein